MAQSATDRHFRDQDGSQRRGDEAGEQQPVGPGRAKPDDAVDAERQQQADGPEEHTGPPC
ncbi:MAG: hypothetical protein DMG01_03585 [Acidobacteria bacterium]|nr:MAG: hypothetical protein DMG01_03585 [Acidobacteriota bacterium]